jgi:hypothetical protein
MRAGDGVHSLVGSHEYMVEPAGGHALREYLAAAIARVSLFGLAV